MSMEAKEIIARRVALELRDNTLVNLGIGLPTLVANYVPENIEVFLQSENGLLGIGPFPTDDEVDADAEVDADVGKARCRYPLKLAPPPPLLLLLLCSVVADAAAF
jgi:3-oxoacid CoA-transferase B subunit